MKTQTVEVEFVEVANGDVLENLAQNFGRIDRQIKELTEQRNKLKGEIIPIFEQRFGHTSHTEGSLKRVIQITQSVNQDKIKKVLSKEEFLLVKVEEVDKDKLISAIKIGMIEASVIQDGMDTREIDKLEFVKEK